MKIVSIGEITLDRYLNQRKSFVGGISLNFAVNAKRAGAEEVSLVSCVGTFDHQPFIATLVDEGVNTEHVMILDGKTAECAIEVDEFGDRSFPADGYHLNVLSQLELTPPIIKFINQHDVAVTMYDGHKPDSLFNKLVESTHPEMKHVVDFGDWSNGRTKPLDPTVLNQIDIAFFSSDEASLPKLIPSLTHESCLVVVTLGASGSVAIDAGVFVKQEAIRTPTIVDTTGCGDAFQGAFTVNYFKNRNTKQALKAGAMQAAQVIQHFGSFTQTYRLNLNF